MAHSSRSVIAAAAIALLALSIVVLSDPEDRAGTDEGEAATSSTARPVKASFAGHRQSIAAPLPRELVEAEEGEAAPQPEKALTDRDRQFIEDLFQERSKQHSDALRSLRAGSLTGLEYARKEADLLRQMAELEAMRGAYESGNVEPASVGEVVGDDLSLEDGYVLTCTHPDGRRTVSFAIDYLAYPHVKACKERVAKLARFALEEAVATFNARPLAERLEAARSDAARRQELTELQQELSDVNRRMDAWDLSDRERSELMEQRSVAMRRFSALMRQLLPLPVDPRDPEMRH